ncbi:MAG: hypothetical protein JWR50_2289 [Mucilaginibacter sp.]|nr:hypothetical protein [Mucilaginibacter sp.]
MIKPIFIVFLVTTLSISQIVTFAQIRKLDSVKLEFEGFNTETIIDVTCDAFDHTFKNTKKIKLVRDKSNLFEFISQIKTFKKLKDKSIDVRGKIIYYYGEETSTYCFDIFGRFYKDGKLYYNKNLLIVISNNLYTNHPKYLDTLRSYE